MFNGVLVVGRRRVRDDTLLRSEPDFLGGDMRNVFVAETAADAAVVRNLLDANGIDAHLVERATSAYPELATEVWLPRDEQRARALELIRTLYSKAVEQGLWSCESCVESNPSQFDLCWACGKPRR
jgi:hypothetical protein